MDGDITGVIAENTVCIGLFFEYWSMRPFITVLIGESGFSAFEGFNANDSQ
jgi:hypothetical protein